jgi:hypothetical protein
MKRGLLAARMLAAMGAVAMLVAACGGSSGRASPKQQVATVPVSTLTRAAYVSSAQSGYKAVMQLRETVGPTQISMVGAGTFRPADHAGSMSIQMTIPGAAGAAVGNSLNIDAVFERGTFYMKMPAVIAGQIPGGKPWLKFNLGALGRAAGISGLSALTKESSTLDDPGQYIDYLRAASGNVKDLGQATVDGVSTTHYHAQIDLSKLADAVPASSRTGVQQLVAQLEKRFSAGDMPVDAWVDSSNRIRRIAITYSLQVPTTGQTSTVAMVMDFSDYGPQPQPAIPPASQTTNLVALLHGSI